MDDIKTKFLDLINKKNRAVKIPAMGFSDYFTQNISSLSGNESQSSTSSSSVSKGKETNNSMSKQKSECISKMNHLPDQEILDSTEEIYFQENIDIGAYEMNKFHDTTLDLDAVKQGIFVLKQQHTVISKKVLQNILEQRTACNEEFEKINEIENILNNSLDTCRKARSHLHSAKINLTTTSLEILATYKKREILLGLLQTLNCIKKMKSTDLQLQNLLTDGNYSGAIEILLECKLSASENIQYKCVKALSQKLQDTMMLTELQLDNVLGEMTQNFDTKKYHELQKAYKMLGKTLLAMDQLHINFISTIHTTAFTVLHNYYSMNRTTASGAAGAGNSSSFNQEQKRDTDESSDGEMLNATNQQQKMLFEQLCESITPDKYTICLINLCKSFWSILVSYYQVTLWHQHSTLFHPPPAPPPSSSSLSSSSSVYSETNQDFNQIADDNQKSIHKYSEYEYIQQKFKNGQSRIWNDIQSKICVYLSSKKLQNLQYEQFIQVLSIVQRLKKVGLEFCNETSSNLIECMKKQSVAFFKRYHSTCLEEICLFLDNEAWMPVNAFSNVTQLQEFRSMKNALQRHQAQITDTRSLSLNMGLSSNGGVGTGGPTSNSNIHQVTDNDNDSQDGASSIYGSCGYFLRFSEKSSPFEGGFDETMFEEDILAGIVDESSCYFSEEGDADRYDTINNNNNNNNNRNLMSSITGNAKTHDHNENDKIIDKNGNNNNNNNNNLSSQITNPSPIIMVNNSSINVLRCIGRYLQMCRLLHSISPEIVHSMTELIDFYIYAVHDIFGKDLPIAGDNLYTTNLHNQLNRINQEIIPKVKNWPPSFTMIHTELCNPETMYGLIQRSVGIESCISLFQQFENLRGYLEYLLIVDRQPLDLYYMETSAYIYDIRKPVFMCSTARIIDIQMILTSMSKVKWDINQVNVEHSNYVNILNRGAQNFSMRLEEVLQIVSISKESIWDSFVHVLTHTLVEGYANAKRCTPGGRALMQLDFAHFMSILELTSGYKYTVHHQYVDAYIKAFYMPKDLLEQWIIEKKAKYHYSSKQLITLINCTCVNDKKTRQKLLTIIDTTVIHHQSPAIPKTTTIHRSGGSNGDTNTTTGSTITAT